MQVKELLSLYRAETRSLNRAEKLKFEGVGENDVYNISAPFELGNRIIIAGRVEMRDNEFSQVRFFEEINSIWQPIEGAPTFELQDPFVTFVDNELIFGGVRVKERSDGNGLEWCTVFYRGKSLNELVEFFQGPQGMKDIRLKELTSGKILVLTRPQGDKGGRGKIGALIIDSLEDLNEQIINNAPLLNGQFTDEEWGGANEIHLIDDNFVFVLGHIANFDSAGDRHYYSLGFKMHLQNFAISDCKILAERSDFEPGDSKRPDLRDVVFTGGMIQDGGRARLYCGTSDAEAQMIEIPNPIKEV